MKSGRGERALIRRPQRRDMRTILLAGGGTGGHIYPNLALLPALERLDIEAFYGGGEGDTQERRAAERAKLDYVGVPCVKFVRSLSPEALANNMSVPRVLSAGTRAAERVLKERSPALVFSKGGFAALPYVLAAARIGIPVICHESDKTAGLSNRIAMIKGATALSAYPGSRFGEFVGMPVREELFCRDGGETRRALGIPQGEKVLLVAGGSSGAKAVNDALFPLLPYIEKRCVVIHLTGRGKAGDAPPRSERYIPIEYSDDMGALYAASDLVLSRAGATAVAELAALGKRAVFVPLPKGVSRGDQIPNAELALRHGGKVIPQTELAAKLFPVLMLAFSQPPMTRISNDANGKIASVIDATIRRGVKCNDKKPSPNGS